MISAIVVGFAASACGGSGSSDNPLLDVDKADVFDRLVEAVAGSDEVFHVYQSDEGSTSEKEIWLAPGGAAARQHDYSKGDLDAVSVYVDGQRHYFDVGTTTSWVPSPEGQLDGIGLYALRYLIDMSYFDELDVRTTTYAGEDALEISGELTVDLPESEFDGCTGESRLLVRADTLTPIREEGSSDCAEGDELIAPMLYRGGEFVPADSLPDDWFRADNLQEQVVSSQFEDAARLGFPLHTFGLVDGAAVKVQHVSITSGTFRGDFPIAIACYEPDGDPPEPYDEWPFCTLDLWQYDAEHFEPDRCGSPSESSTVELDHGTSAQLCAGASRVLEFEHGETAIRIITSGTFAGGGELNPYNNNEGIIALANSLVPVP